MPTYPYAQPIGGFESLVQRLRSNFPEKVDAQVLKKYGIAPNNESYLINTIRFLGLIDADCVRNTGAHDIFVKPDPEFQNAFAELSKVAYKGLFELYGDDAWSLDKQKLISFFRSEDKSSDLIGNRQADTFIKIAVLAEKRKNNGSVSESVKKEKPKQKPAKVLAPEKVQSLPIEKLTDKREINGKSADVELAVRIEVNLPATSDQSVYDAIFKSIRENLINRD